MVTRQINLQNPDAESIQLATQVLREGGIIIYPTDTCYAIGVDPTNKVAIDKLARLKRNSAEKAFSILVRTIDEIPRYALVDDQVNQLLHTYLPGPFSFLLVNLDFHYCPLSGIVLRVPNSPVMQALSNSFGYPFTTTSANVSGEDPAYSLEELDQSLLDPENLTVIPDLILDGGELSKRLVSTIIDVTNWPPKLLRQGSGIYRQEHSLSE